MNQVTKVSLIVTLVLVLVACITVPAYYFLSRQQSDQKKVKVDTVEKPKSEQEPRSKEAAELREKVRKIDEQLASIQHVYDLVEAADRNDKAKAKSLLQKIDLTIPRNLNTFVAHAGSEASIKSLEYLKEFKAGTPSEEAITTALLEADKSKKLLRLEFMEHLLASLPESVKTLELWRSIAKRETGGPMQSYGKFWSEKGAEAIFKQYIEETWEPSKLYKYYKVAVEEAQDPYLTAAFSPVYKKLGDYIKENNLQ